MRSAALSAASYWFLLREDSVYSARDGAPTSDMITGSAVEGRVVELAGAARAPARPSPPRYMAGRRPRRVAAPAALADGPPSKRTDTSVMAEPPLHLSFALLLGNLDVNQNGGLADHGLHGELNGSRLLTSRYLVDVEGLGGAVRVNALRVVHTQERSHHPPRTHLIFVARRKLVLANDKVPGVSRCCWFPADILPVPMQDAEFVARLCLGIYF